LVVDGGAEPAGGVKVSGGVSELRARAYWTVGRARGELRDERLTPPAADQALVQTLHTAISRGTERVVHEGRVPPSEYERMRAPHQAGSFPWPVKYGYCNVGRVVRGGGDLLGREVFCLYPHQSAYVVERAALCPLPAGVPAARAVLAANMETALNAIWDAELKAGDRVAVVGAGVVGLLVAYLAARHPATEVQVIDVDASKAAPARARGGEFAEAARARGDADVVVHASGSPSGLPVALALAGREASVLELSFYGDAQVSLPLGGSFHPLRLSLRSSQVGSLPAAQRARWTFRRRLEAALRLLADPRLDVLIDARAPFSELPRVMAELADGTRRVTCQRIDYEGEAPCTE
jgi:NADPH:quinone reductase-like Zn-dependent oxidoreductase